MTTTATMTHFWRWKKYLPERFGQKCRIVSMAKGPGPKSVLVEFEDGHKTVTLRYALRRLAAAVDGGHVGL